MHELGIAQTILQMVGTELSRRPGARPRKVVVRIGELSGVNEDSLQFGFEVLAREAGFDGLILEIQTCPRRHRCRACSAEFAIRDYNFQCPRCGALESDCIAGDELELAYLELEEHEPSPA